MRGTVRLYTKGHLLINDIIKSYHIGHSLHKQIILHISQKVHKNLIPSVMFCLEVTFSQNFPVAGQAFPVANEISHDILFPLPTVHPPLVFVTATSASFLLVRVCHVTRAMAKKAAASC